ncbi:D-hexose-6-phosphate mutarotase [Xylophilus sp.]|uniref:D-hexose-6-phosphate mutarotase n=1 Tax=Xylophilus sp. TaxID=2653893 RepID=UPI0013B72173|nr:D-hexose-6-phosphate mutarotase [Xylophilus sp.]KAF1045723.1 MAG: putative glucose-6-phosphate 1-epimerase [Xylophilus sp.]
MSRNFIDFHGQPAIALALLGGDRAVVLPHGAQVVSWQTSDGAERLYLSPQAVLDGQAAIRGGVPVCFPQFNQRGPLVKHGFARHMPWQVEEAQPARAVLGLRRGVATQAFWPAHFHARLTVELRPGALKIHLSVANTGASTWSFTTALHTYLRVDDVQQVRLDGLDGAARWDAVADCHAPQQGAPAFGAEFDSVYQAPAQILALTEPGRGTLHIAQSSRCPQTVVWNPGPVLARTLADLPDEDWRHLLCVEAASVDAPVALAPGARWQGWQQLRWSASS